MTVVNNKLHPPPQPTARGRGPRGQPFCGFSQREGASSIRRGAFKVDAQGFRNQLHTSLEKGASR